MIVPIVGIELLGAMEVFGRQFGLCMIVEPDRQLETRLGFHLGLRARLHAPGELFVRKRIAAVLAVFDPIAQRRDIKLAFGDQAFAAEFPALIGAPGRLGGPDDTAALINPNSGRYIDELVGGADGMLRVDQCRKCRLGLVVPGARGAFSARILRCSDDLKVLSLQLLVNLLPSRQIEAAASPGGPGEHQHLLAPKVG